MGDRQDEKKALVLIGLNHVFLSVGDLEYTCEIFH